LDPAIPKVDAAAGGTAGEGVKKCVDTLAEVFRRCNGLFTASTFATLTPILQHDFFAAFRQPWMREGYAPPSGPFYDA
jgi:hypothetical protein